ncbi:MAG: archease [Planctomycetes bacterium]|nr:archease [Planctomycetota bacterium]
MPDYRLFDHTADVGIEWEAGSLPELFEKGAAALADLVAGPEGASGATAGGTVAIEALDLPDLLVVFLQELRFRFETRGELLGAVRVERLDPGSGGGAASLVVRASGRVFDPARDRASTVIKAVTYHRLAVEPAPGGGWTARVLFDT